MDCQGLRGRVCAGISRVIYVIACLDMKSYLHVIIAYYMGHTRSSFQEGIISLIVCAGANCVETWYHKSRDDLNLMRATTTLALTHSNGYCLFSDPNPLPSADHRHNWYGFWDKSLAKPAGSRIDRPDGAVLREFEKGTVVYNPMGNKPVNVEFADARKSLATGKAGKRHTVGSCDGDIFLKTQ